MKQVIATILITFCFIFLNADYTVYHDDYDTAASTYTDSIAAVTSDISSDFGRRDYSGSEWHKGIDYAGSFTLGDHIRSLESGNIEKIYYKPDEIRHLKFIAISNTASESFGYLHLFNNEIIVGQEVSGDMIITNLKTISNEYGIVKDNTTDPLQSVAMAAYQDSVDFVWNNTDYTIPTQTTVSAGSIIAPVGYSGMISPDKTHFHLSRYRNGSLDTLQTKHNCIDPLEVLSHAQPNYEITIDSVYTVYPGDSLSSVKVRCKMLKQQI
ncbi:MAG: hypothetical protein R6U84_04515 [Candidatus Cloacimonadales bacterium]